MNKSTRLFKSILFSTTLLCLTNALANEGHGTPDAREKSVPVAEATGAATKDYPLQVCLVTDSDLGSMGDETELVYQGQTIKFCCKPCEAKFLKNPAKYLKKLEKAVEKAKPKAD